MNYQDILAMFWKKEQRVFYNNLAILKQYSQKEAVHDIRVSIKKLRAALELYVLLNEEPLWKYPLKKTETLFSILGKQRDIEICIEFLRAFESGLELKEIAEKMQISYKTADAHRANLLQALGARNPMAGIEIAKKAGII